ncbi:MAG: hypothetical protein AB7I79_18315 [Rhizobiaceae bacterium]
MSARIITTRTASRELKNAGGTIEDKYIVELAISDNALAGEPLDKKFPALRRKTVRLLAGHEVAIIFLGIPFDDHLLFDGDLAVILAVRSKNIWDWKIPDPDNLAQAVQAILDALQIVVN